MVAHLLIHSKPERSRNARHDKCDILAFELSSKIKKPNINHKVTFNEATEVN